MHKNRYYFSFRVCFESPLSEGNELEQYFSLGPGKWNETHDAYEINSPEQDEPYLEKTLDPWLDSIIPFIKPAMELIDEALGENYLEVIIEEYLDEPKIALGLPASTLKKIALLEAYLDFDRYTYKD